MACCWAFHLVPQLNIHSVTVENSVMHLKTHSATNLSKTHSGCVLAVHYTGTLLDGSKFDSSRDRDDPFVFTLKEGEARAIWFMRFCLLTS